MSFELPSMHTGPGWGPPKTEDSLPFDIPYQPFWKGEKLGKVMEWLPDRMGRGRGNKYGYNEALVDEEEKEWTTTDYNKVTPKHRGPWRGRGRGRGMGMRGQGFQQRPRPGGPGGRGVGGAKPKKKLDTRPDFRRRDVHRQASIEVKQSWIQAAQIPIAELTQTAKEMPHDNPKSTEEILEQNGKPRLYNKPQYEYMRLGKPVMDIPQLNRQFDSSNALDSATMVGFIKKFRKHDGPAFYGADMILATLMSSTKSTIPWDIQIERVGDSYFMSCTKNSIVGKWTVNESAMDAPPCEEPTGAGATEEQKNNSQPRLSEELSTVTQNFSQMLLDWKKEAKQTFPAAPTPEDIEGKPADVLYVYKKWNLPNNMLLCGRTHVDGFLTNKAERYKAFPLLLHGQKQLQQLSSNVIGAMRGTEIQYNCCRMIKQLAVSYLAGVQHMKIGFVSRKRPDNRKSHVLHHIESVETRDQAAALSTSPKALWNILIRILTEIVRAKNKEKNQRFVLMKDPSKPTLRLYDTTNADDEESEDEDEDEEEEEEESESDSD